MDTLLEMVVEFVLNKYIVTLHHGRRNYIRLPNDVVSKVEFSANLVEFVYILVSPRYSLFVMNHQFETYYSYQHS